MSDMEKLFYQEISEKKKGLSGVHAKTGKRGHVGKLFTMDDFLKGKSKREYRGTTKVRSWNMFTNIIPKDEFLKLSIEEQKRQLEHWRAVYSAKKIMEEMGIHSQSLYNLMDNLGIKYPKRQRKKKDGTQESGIKNSSPTKQKNTNNRNSSYDHLFPELPKDYTLSTGEMVDYLLRHGGKAETKQGMTVEYSETEARILATGTGRTLQLDRMFLLLTWRVLPNLVTFDEAIKLYQEGHAVKCSLNGKYTIFIKENKSHSINQMDFAMICEGEWVVAKMKKKEIQLQELENKDLVT